MVLLAGKAYAQTVTGSGTPGTLPYWTGTTTLGDSNATISATAGLCLSPSITHIYNVKCYGAIGDGIADDAPAIQAALNGASAVYGQPVTVYFPPGSYLINETLSVNVNVTHMDILGHGRSSRILWNLDADAIDFLGTFQWNSIRDLTFVPTTLINAHRFAISCPRGSEQSLFQNIYMIWESASNWFPSGIFLGNPAAGTTIIAPYFWRIAGTGISIDQGSEIRVMGGRITGWNGTGTMQNGSIGIYVRGNNGGVHVQDTDLINLQFGMLLSNDNGSGSNREIFINHATFDGDYQGLVVNDASYVDVTGVWAASATKENIYVGFGSPLIVIAGGTIFNAGAFAVADVGNGANGMTVNSGTFILNGVAIRNNYNAVTNPNGHGLWVPNSSVHQFVVNGCRFTANGWGVHASNAGAGSFTGNVFFSNPNGNLLGSSTNSGNTFF